MQQVSNAYAQAITAGYRRILPRALIDITDPEDTMSVARKKKKKNKKKEKLQSRGIRTILVGGSG